ncbi:MULTISPECIES: hydrolase [Streptomyces]|uniref:hydrolase n=1 Tax=Streptomyces TaxID=1883 RepID=UPI0004BD5FB5|nr:MULTISPECIES: hydrolase [Streptomyces]KJY16547.1 hydrolase [Streptomyces sp. NRRL S-104]KOU33179.1 hydrolase [Streptomyces sp. WM6373]KOU64400.1 hydrolase [Streptomyces sp. IGB124]KOU86749.1 hydrolase [Streptomyces sp. XY58]KOU99471.1 hydrolase [Streptomyces sp. XY37]
MPADPTGLALGQDTALVLIDLQTGILALPTTRPAPEVLERGVALAAAFRAHRLPVVLVKVAWSPDGGDLPTANVDRPGPASAPPAAFSEIPAELAALGDVVVTKRHWGAFTGTELDLQLRRRGIHRIVLAGISTSVGVESTARTAWELSYDLVFPEDATADTDPDSHTHTFGKIFPRIGRVTTTDEVIAALRP